MSYASFLLRLLTLGFLLSTLMILGVFYYFGHNLPSHGQLKNYELPTVTRLYANDGQLMDEYAIEKRIFVPFQAIPTQLVEAFIAVEDSDFYHHFGIDFVGIARAAILNVLKNRRPHGASTITQQVARNFLLTNEVSYKRKIQEAILAVRIEQAIPKERILELYLNKIYLGLQSHGVASAALNYFDKSLDELTLAQMAYLAALPKGPNNYHPVRRKAEALSRRNYVLRRMVDVGSITETMAEEAMTEDLIMIPRTSLTAIKADYFSEEVRRIVHKKYGEDALYNSGLVVHTTLDPVLQEKANKAFRDGIIRYDRSRGWRGALNRLTDEEEAESFLRKTHRPAGAGQWQLAVVTKVGKQQANILVKPLSSSLKSSSSKNWALKKGVINLADVTWGRSVSAVGDLGPVIRSVTQLLAEKDVILVSSKADKPKLGVADLSRHNISLGKNEQDKNYDLQQLPAVNGALVAMDPKTGRVLAMVGGYSFTQSKFNRATQAVRQIGSLIKPFVYLAALDNGYTPATRILDGPITLPQGPGLPLWRPQNFERNFLGPTRLRVGLEKSRNLITVRLAHQLGIDKVAEYVEKFGVMDYLPRYLSMSLGASDTTMMRIVRAFGQLANGGRAIDPTLIDRVQDRTGHTIYRHDERSVVEGGEGMPPEILDHRAQLVNPDSVYQIVSILEGAVRRGTGRVMQPVGKTLASKSGSTNTHRDAWMAGFIPDDLVAAVYVGFDDSASLGKKASGARVAGPILRDFMKEALANVPDKSFRVPPTINFMAIDTRNGRLAHEGTPGNRRLLEAFKEGDKTESAIYDDHSYAPAPSQKTFQNHKDQSSDSFVDLQGVY
jgi:penicillin-binding protein 1A